MTIKCPDCHKTLGEKCPKCGALALVYVDVPSSVPEIDAPVLVFAKYMAICRNPECDYRFTVGEGGDTSGLCEPCYKQEMARLVCLPSAE